MKIKNILKDNIIYIIFSIIIGIFIIKYQYNPADDIEYKTLLDKMGRLNFLKLEYFHWSGRLSVYIIGALFKYDLNIWKISNILLSFLFIKSFSYYYSPFLKRKNEKRNLDQMIFMCIFLIFPYTITSVFVWMTGSYHYLYPVTAMIYSLIPYYYLLFVRKKLEFSGVKWVFLYLSIFIAAYVEQTIFVLLILQLISLYLILKQKNIEVSEKKNISFYFLFFLINFIISRLAPGFDDRLRVELKWYPNYKNMPFSFRLYEVINLTNKHLLVGSSLLFFIFVLLLTILIHKKYRNRLGIMYIPLLYIVINFVPLDLLSDNIMLWSNGKNLYNSTPRTLFLKSSVDKLLFDVMKPLMNIDIPKIDYLPSIIAFSIIVFLSFLFFYCYEEKRKAILNFIVYWIALGSVYLLVFSPTIYASGSRIFFVMNCLFMFLISQLYIELINKYDINNNKYFKFGKVILMIYIFSIICSYTVYLTQSVSA
ncbi:Uncharacterised protein [uncultured Leptotrichia sp.]|uniref:DUF6056 family protein n=1 Tax=uncultured Leptotrichia sp. TaxID=159271 RepID=UPI001A5FED20|nr:DUF6056 family protein [uncultured Leptotrichia sp.]VTX49124.1 Uncharacterised protein [uncultured Leptotrichia sp.]